MDIPKIAVFEYPVLIKYVIRDESTNTIIIREIVLVNRGLSPGVSGIENELDPFEQSKLPFPLLKKPPEEVLGNEEVVLEDGVYSSTTSGASPSLSPSPES